MLAVSNQTKNSNRLLATLTSSDLARLRPHLTALNFKLLLKFEVPNKPIEYIYFPHAGIASVVAEQGDGSRAEIGLIGREGMSGSSVLLGNDRSPHSTYIQVAGAGERMLASELRKALSDSETLRQSLLRYVQSFMVQTSHTAVANGYAKLPARLARWLLMAHDRLGDDRLPLTHEFLALMLAVRRAGVTEALQSLRNKKLIRAERGQIVVLDRKGLERVAGDFYGTPEQEYRRLVN